VHRVGPPRKSYSGAGGPQGTACPRGQSPEAARLVSPIVATACRDNRELKHSRRRSEPNGTWARGVETRPSPAQAGSRLRREQRTPRASVDAQPRVRPGRENQPAGPVRHRDRKPVTNDPRGGACNAKEKKCRREASENRKGARPGRWVPAGQKTPKRDSRRVGNPGDGTARPVNAAGTHEDAKPHESRPDEPVNRGGNSTGRRRRLTTSAEAGAVAVVKRQRDASGVEAASQPRPRV
jgi:hypothetical protein